jgi:nucleotide-binding universal stress UspA family protein
MIKLASILFPTDFSKNAQRALEYACFLGERFGARLHVLHVLPDPWVLVPDPGSAYGLPSAYEDRLRKEAEESLARLALETGTRDKTVQALRKGSEPAEIVRYAREHQLDLIVMGTHGRTGLSHAFLGSVAEQVVRTAGCPVLTVRHEDFKLSPP